MKLFRTISLLAFFMVLSSSSFAIQKEDPIESDNLTQNTLSDNLIDQLEAPQILLSANTTEELIVSDNLVTEVIPLPSTELNPFEHYSVLSSNLLHSAKATEETLDILSQYAETYFHTFEGLGRVFVEHTVQPGQYLGHIARYHKVSLERIEAFNPEIDPNRIFPGQKIKVVKGPNQVIVSKSAYTMHLFIQGYYYKTFTIGIGREGKSTPLMKTSVTSSRAKFPSYTHPDTKIVYPYGDPENPIGTRWIGLACGQGYGIHGTNDEASIGKAMSRGCIRMKQNDLELLYNILYIGDEVEILP